MSINSPQSINVAFTITNSVVFNAPVQQTTFLDATNQSYLRQMFLSQDGIKMVASGAVVQVPMQQLFAAAANYNSALTWPPIILGQPTSSVASSPPLTASFAVSASAEIPITYSWQSGSSSTGSWATSTNSGSSSPQVYIPLVITLSAPVFYRCILSDASGFVTSSVVSLSTS